MNGVELTDKLYHRMKNSQSFEDDEPPYVVIMRLLFILQEDREIAEAVREWVKGVPRPS